MNVIAFTVFPREPLDIRLQCDEDNHSSSRWMGAALQGKLPAPWACRMLMSDNASTCQAVWAAFEASEWVRAEVRLCLEIFRRAVTAPKQFTELSGGFYASRTSLSSVPSGILTVPDEHYNREEEAHRAQVFREIRTGPHYYLQDLGRTNINQNSHILTGFTSLSWAQSCFWTVWSKQVNIGLHAFRFLT